MRYNYIGRHADKIIDRQAPNSFSEVCDSNAECGHALVFVPTKMSFVMNMDPSLSFPRYVQSSDT
jgi:hypothetical protein